MGGMKVSELDFVRLLPAFMRDDEAAIALSNVRAFHVFDDFGLVGLGRVVGQLHVVELHLRGLHLHNVGERH